MSRATPIKDPWLVHFRTGRRLKAWNKNVVSLGLASGFIEPLESTSIHLTISAIVRLVQLFPFEGIPASLVELYNDASRAEMEHVRDFIILHYHATQRDEPMWKECREMELPESLAIRLRAWRERAHAWQGADELFRIDSWTHVLLGQGIVPEQHHPLGAGAGRRGHAKAAGFHPRAHRPRGREVALAAGFHRALLQGRCRSLGIATVRAGDPRNAMLLTVHPEIRIARRTIGAEGAPLLVMDNVASDPDRLVRKAASSHFVKQSSMFPGIRAPAPLSYQQFLQATLNPLLRECFDLEPGRFAFPMCHFSLVTQPPGELAFLQRVPHIDSVRGDGLATVHYLFRANWGGTAFYRHRQSGFEYIDEQRHRAYFDCLAQESNGGPSRWTGYIDGDTPLFQRIAEVEGVFNRLIVYRRNSLHSGRIDNALVPPADPSEGRLSINTFIDLVR